MASDVGDVAVRLSDNLYEGRGGKATASELSSHVAGLMDSADFSRLS